MKIIISGQTPLKQFDPAKTVNAVHDRYLQKLSEDDPEAYASLTANLESEVVLEFTVNLAYKLRGQDELQLMTTDPLGEGHAEQLVVTAEVDADGKLLFDSIKDNDEESEFSTIEALIAEGLPDKFEQIDSQYYSDELVEEAEITVSDMTVAIFTTLDNSKVVVQYQQDNALIAEFEIANDSDTVQANIIEYFQQLN